MRHATECIELQPSKGVVAQFNTQIGQLLKDAERAKAYMGFVEELHRQWEQCLVPSLDEMARYGMCDQSVT